jgi:hypothetical protein
MISGTFLLEIGRFLNKSASEVTKIAFLKASKPLKSIILKDKGVIGLESVDKA